MSELTSSSSGSYTYDANGNTLSDPSGKSYSWDFENQLTQAVVPGTGTVSFKYDPFGRRIYKQSPNATSIFVYDGVSLVGTINASGSEVASYTQGPLIDEPLAELRGSTTDYYAADGLGSITSLSNSTGALANTYTYDSFGNTTASTGTVRNYFQYTAREFDSETNLYFYRARYFDPNSGRFISGDPIGFHGGVNFYRYVLNNPLINIDPPGLGPYGWGNKSWTWTSRANCFISYYACLSHIAETRQSLDQMTDDAVGNTSDAMGSQGGYSNQRLQCGLRQDQNCKDALTRCTKLAHIEHLCVIALYREALRQRRQIAHPAKTLAGIYLRKFDYHVNAATHRD
ncbi:MAG: RHS repeat-associated core domain-containing protein [Candidatus Sulfotelmatobacter sp.]